MSGRCRLVWHRRLAARWWVRLDCGWQAETEGQTSLVTWLVQHRREHR